MTVESALKPTNARIEDWQTIRNLIGEFALDDNDLSIDKFIVCKEGNSVLGFGRIKDHPDCDELCTLGVIPERRNRGIGKLLIKQLIKLTTKKVFLATIIPDYFARQGFEKTNQFPASMVMKQKYCRHSCGNILPTIMTTT